MKRNDKRTMDPKCSGVAAEQDDRAPFQPPTLTKLGTLARVVQQSGPVTVSGGRT
jgi:hypothetical protein